MFSIPLSAPSSTTKDETAVAARAIKVMVAEARTAVFSITPPGPADRPSCVLWDFRSAFSS